MAKKIYIEHAYEDEWDSWRYLKDCGCTLCLEYENEREDDAEADRWDNTDYPLDILNESWKD